MTTTTQDTHKTIEIGIGKSSLAKEMIADLTQSTPDRPNRISTDLRYAFFNAGISAAYNADATRDILVEYDNLTYCNLNFF